MALRDIKSKKPKGGIQVGNIANTKYYKMPDGSIVDDQGKLAPAAFAKAFGDVTPAAKPKIQIKRAPKPGQGETSSSTLLMPVFETFLRTMDSLIIRINNLNSTSKQVLEEYKNLYDLVNNLNKSIKIDFAQLQKNIEASRNDFLLAIKNLSFDTGGDSLLLAGGAGAGTAAAASAAPSPPSPPPDGHEFLDMLGLKKKPEAVKSKGSFRERIKNRFGRIFGSGGPGAPTKSSVPTIKPSGGTGTPEISRPTLKEGLKYNSRGQPIDAKTGRFVPFNEAIAEGPWSGTKPSTTTGAPIKATQVTPEDVSKNFKNFADRLGKIATGPTAQAFGKVATVAAIGLPAIIGSYNGMTLLSESNAATDPKTKAQKLKDAYEEFAAGAGGTIGTVLGGAIGSLLPGAGTLVGSILGEGSGDTGGRIIGRTAYNVVELGMSESDALKLEFYRELVKNKQQNLQNTLKQIGDQGGIGEGPGKLSKAEQIREKNINERTKEAAQAQQDLQKYEQELNYNVVPGMNIPTGNPSDSGKKIQTAPSGDAITDTTNMSNMSKEQDAGYYGTVASTSILPAQVYDNSQTNQTSSGSEQTSISYGQLDARNRFVEIKMKEYLGKAGLLTGVA